MKWFIAAVALGVAVKVAPSVRDRWMRYWQDVADQVHGKKAWVMQ